MKVLHQQIEEHDHPSNFILKHQEETYIFKVQKFLDFSFTDFKVSDLLQGPKSAAGLPEYTLFIISVVELAKALSTVKTREEML